MANITLRRSPWRSPLSSLFDRDPYTSPMGRFYDLFGHSPDHTERVGMMPAVEIAESDTEFTCTTELPGLTENDVEVSFDANELRIKGEKREQKESEERGKRYHVWERSYGAFERTFTFPTEVDASKITADFRGGVLTIRLPKAHNGTSKARVIPLVTK